MILGCFLEALPGCQFQSLFLNVASLRMQGMLQPHQSLCQSQPRHATQTMPPSGHLSLRHSLHSRHPMDVSSLVDVYEGLVIIMKSAGYAAHICPAICCAPDAGT